MANISLDKNLLAWSSLGAVGVISGVVVKNSMEQLGKSKSVVGTFVGPALFVGGWLVFLYAVVLALDGGLGTNWIPKLQAAAAVAMIVGSVLYMKQQMAAGKDVAPYVAVLFPIGWVLLAYTIGIGGLDSIPSVAKLTGAKSVLSLGAAGAVLLSMMWALPWQRKNCVVDGPGMPLFASAWAALIAANSMVT